LSKNILQLILMLFFDFSKNVLPVSENVYFQKVIDFVKKWQSNISDFQISTSGSTGVPQLIDINRAQMVASASLTIQTFGLKKQDHLLCCLNVNFIGGMMMLVRAIELKAQLTVIEPVNNPFLQISKDSAFDFVALVPMQIQAILFNEASKKYLMEHSGIRNIIIGGAPLNTNILSEIDEIAIPCFATYGMTETVSHIAIKHLNGPDKSEYFRKLENIEIGVDNRNCLKIKGLCTNSLWVQTNDIVLIKDEFEFQLIGRANRVVNSGGVKIYLDLIEKEIEPNLIQYLVKPTRYFLFGVEDAILGEKLCLLIEAENPKLMPNMKVVFKNSILSKYKIPKAVYFLPKFVETESGKIDFNKSVNQIKIS
jgi:o-succinylbenzoate---CoA ligase